MKIHPNFMFVKSASTIRLAVALLGATLLFQLAPSSAVALPQEAAKYESLPIAAEYQLPSKDGVNMSDRAERTAYLAKVTSVTRLQQSMVKRVAARLSGESNEISDSEMNAYIDGFLVPSMASLDEMTLSELGKNRKDLFRQFLRTARGPARDNFIAKLVTEMKKLVEGNYHPACRVNAMVVLSELNRVEGNRTTQTMPQPEPTMLAYMLGVLQNKSLPPYLTPTALAGLERHAACRRPGTPNPLSGAEATQISDAMLVALALDPDEQKGVDEDVIDWNKRRAVRILGTVGAVGASGKYALKLREIFSNEKASTAMRVDAVRAYGLLSFNNAQEADVKATTLVIGKLMAKLADDEANYIEKKINDIKFTVKFLDETDASSSGKTGGGGKKGPGGPGTGVGADDDGSGGGRGGRDVNKKKIPEVLPYYHRDVVKRRIKDRIWVTKSTLGGISKGRLQQNGLKDLVDETSDEAKLIAKLVKVMDQLMKDTDVFEVAEEDRPDDAEPRTESYADELKTGLRKGAEEMRAIVGASVPEKEAAADEAADAAKEGAVGGDAAAGGQ